MVWQYLSLVHALKTKSLIKAHSVFVAIQDVQPDGATETPLAWYARKATLRKRLRTASRLRQVQARELQVALPSPPAPVPRVITTAKWALPPRPRPGVAPSHAAHALEAAEIALPGQQDQADGDGHG